MRAVRSRGRGIRNQRPATRRGGAVVRLLLAISWIAPLALPALGEPAEPTEDDRREHVEFDGPRLILPSRLVIEPIRAVELVPGGVFSAAFDGSSTPPGGPISRVVRELPALWRYDTNAAGAAAIAVEASYTVVGADGRAGALTLAGSDEAMPVALEPIEPAADTLYPGRVRIRGGVILHFELDQLTRSGPYTGVLTVTVQHY